MAVRKFRSVYSYQFLHTYTFFEIGKENDKEKKTNIKKQSYYSHLD